MKQILQSLKTGATEVAEIPVPGVRSGQLLIQTRCSLVSAGTERMLIEFGKANLFEKARQQPDKVRMVLDKVKVDGIQPTIEAVLNKLDQPTPMGYCNVGRVIALGPGVNGFDPGVRVVSNGNHAQVVAVPINLCAKIPDAVSDEEATFTVLGAIALQGIRLVQPTLGETIVVTGLGLIGLLTVQLLRANGCRVLGLDYDQEKLELARKFGAEVVDLSAGQDPVKTAQLFSRGRGVDGVIVTAATNSSEPMHQAALMCRKRGRIVLVGVAGLELSRDDFFKKELTFQVSASYGPGRYDSSYEEKGQDYPIGFVRWTEQRNFEAVLDMMAEGRLNVKPLISHRFGIQEADKAYDLVSGQSTLGILLNYPEEDISHADKTISLCDPSLSHKSITKNFTNRMSVSFIGAGNYATSMLIPAFKDSSIHLRSVASMTGVSGLYAARRFGFDEVTTDANRLFYDNKTDAVVVTTQHNSHAEFVLKAIECNKNIFIEKPLCLTLPELDKIQASYSRVCDKNPTPPILMVGFNRRFSPHIQKIKALLSGVKGPKSFVITVNSGAIPPDHWTQITDTGGGRIVGEACHFIDLLRFLSGAKIKSWSRVTMSESIDDTTTISLRFFDGSIGTIHYFSNGSKAFPKERLEVFAAGRILQLDNYRKLTGFGWPNFKKMNLWRQDKGQKLCVRTFIDAVSTKGSCPIPIDEIFEVSRISIEIAQHKFI